MADFVSRMIPLKSSLSDRVFPVANAVMECLKVFRADHRKDETPIEFNRGAATIEVKNPNFNVLSISFTVATQKRSLDLWFDYPEHSDENAKFNLFLHIGDWGLCTEILDGLEQALKSDFFDVVR